MNAVEKYLARYAEPETLLLDGFPGGFSHGLVIPAYREDSEFINRLADFSRANAGTLVILIVNRPDLLSAENALQEESISAQWAEEIFTELNQYEITWSANNSQLSLYSIASGSGVLTVDRCLIGSAIPGDQGVGLARKIGNDVLCSLIHSKNVKSPWMANTDADVRLPLNYFSAQTLERSSCSAILYPFKHIFVDEIPKLPTLLYEYSLNYYMAGLSWAGSPYAYHTVGSTLAVNFQHYCQVRGFPKRPAAEDFWKSVV